jgi:CBS domain containing-hemolysin-like protein
MTLLILFVALALVVSFVCSILEAVLLSATPAHVAVLESEGHPVAGRLRRYKESIDRPLAAILSLNTIANTVGAAGAGAQVGQLFGSSAVGIFSGLLTLAILVGSEIVPKTLGALYWKRLAPLVVRILAVLIVVMLPLVKLAEWLTALLSGGRRAAVVSRAEITALAEAGQRAGVVEEGESRVLRNLFRLSGVRVAEIMTPADAVFALPETMRIAEAVERCADVPYSRVPVYQEAGGSRRYTGFVLKDDVLQAGARDEHGRDLLELRRAVLTVLDSTPLPRLFDRMLRQRHHLALAVDAAERLCGIVSMEDIVETLLGLEIFDELDEAAPHNSANRDGRGGRRRPANARLGITGGAAPSAG